MSRSRDSQAARAAQPGRRLLCPRGSPRRSSFARWAAVAILASLGLSAAAHADDADRWRPIPDVGLLERVVLRIHWFDSAKELREAAENSGQGIRETGLNGFSILKRNTKTGEYSCDLYVVRMTGAFIDGDRTTTFGHEVLHCFGLKHK